VTVSFVIVVLKCVLRGRAAQRSYSATWNVGCLAKRSKGGIPGHRGSASPLCPPARDQRTHQVIKIIIVSILTVDQTNVWIISHDLRSVGMDACLN